MRNVAAIVIVVIIKKLKKYGNGKIKKVKVFFLFNKNERKYLHLGRTALRRPSAWPMIELYVVV